MCQTVFDEIDTEKNKTISITELENATKKLAEQFKMAQPTKEEIQKEFKSIDQNKDKTLDFKEFKTYMRSLFGKHLQYSYFSMAHMNFIDIGQVRVGNRC